MCGDDQIKAKAKDGRLLSDLDSDGCAAATTWVEGETAMLMADVDGDGNFQSDGDICNSSRIKLSSASEPFRMLCRSARTPVCVKLIATHVVSIWTEIRFHLTIRRCCFSPCLPSARNRVRRWHQHPTSRIEEHFNEKNAHCPDFFNVCCYEF